MGTVLASERYGGQWATTFSASASLGWSETRRAVVLYPLAGGLTIDLVAAARKEIPEGYFVWVIVNGNPGVSFTLTDGTWSMTLEGDRAAIISKVVDNGVARFVADKREVLT